MPRRVLQPAALVLAGGVLTFALSVVMPIVALVFAFATVIFLIMRTGKEAGPEPSDAMLAWAIVGVLAAETVYWGLAVAALGVTRAAAVT